jgi:5-methylcytosine-specific restriction protein B
LNRVKKSSFSRFNVSEFENFVFQQNESIDITSKNPTITHPLNTIFYGPPGTGKTYHTILRAAEIIANKSIKNYDEAKRIFQEHLGNRIEFITFHQNYSYEDFIQGLRPIQNSNGPLAFEMKDGIFKKIAHRAEENYLSSQWKEINKRPFEDTFQDFFEDLLNGEVEEIEIPMKKASYYITNIGSKSLEFRKASGGTAHTLSINTLRQMYISESTLDIQGLSVYYTPLLDQLLKKGRSKGNSTRGKELQSYVIVIDEINRANISRVFGELITLIEPDKRLGAANELTIKLPNDEVFCIPKNLYFIGTMNTADKSIALLDIALRRRFDFEPMYPIYETNDAPIPFASHLEKMNQEIIRSKGHDFQIGHAYFMGENENLVSIINQKVIPLLMEYFMNDGDEVKRILHKSGFVVDEKSWPLKISGTI